MEYTKTPAGIMIPKSNEFDLMQTLDCGQSFRWEPCNEKSNRIGGIASVSYTHLFPTRIRRPDTQPMTPHSSS